jgi:predicted  nucleic acid-binding Zn-ribbon protein
MQEARTLAKDRGVRMGASGKPEIPRKVEALKREIDRHKKELDDLKKTGGDWKTKYEKEHSDFEEYKTAQTAKETKAAKVEAYKALLKETGITAENRVNAILKITDIEGIELDADGKIKDADKHRNTIKTDFSEFITQTTTRGAEVATPPANTGKQTLTKDQIMAIKDPTERRAAIAKNLSQFEGEKNNE